MLYSCKLPTEIINIHLLYIYHYLFPSGYEKTSIYIFILLPLIVKAQTFSDWDPSLYDWNEDAQSYYYPIITDNNMSAIFLPGSLSDFAGGQLMAFKDGVPVSASLHNL